MSYYVCGSCTGLAFLNTQTSPCIDFENYEKASKSLEFCYRAM